MAGRSTRSALAVVAFLLAVAVVWSLSVYRYTPDITETGSFQDFRDAGYYAAQSLVDGNNPYDVALFRATYPVGQEFPLLPPTYPALHIAFLLLDLLPAAVVFTILSIVGIVALSAWSLRLAGLDRSWPTVLLVAAAALVSNGGRLTIIFGQATVLWVAGTYLAIMAQDDRAGSAGLAVAITKPTFGLPVAVILAGWGRWRRTLIGTAVAAGIALLLLVPIVSWAGGISPFLDTVEANWEASGQNEGASLETTMARIDVASTIRQYTGWVAPFPVEVAIAVVVIGGSALLLAAAARRRVPIDAVAVVVCVATLSGIYHLYYDLLLLVLPTLLVLRPTFAGGVPRALRLTLLGALLIANFNVLHSLTFAERVPDAVARALGPGLTGLAVIVALICAVGVVRRAVQPTGSVPTLSS